MYYKKEKAKCLLKVYKFQSPMNNKDYIKSNHNKRIQQETKHLKHKYNKTIYIIQIPLKYFLLTQVK